MLAQLHVLTRLRGETPELHDGPSLDAYLGGACAGLLDQLESEWYHVPDGATKRELRDEYAQGGGRAAKTRSKK